MNEAPSASQAVTLLELLVSITVLFILVVFITAIVSAVNQTWASGERRVEVYQNGRAILDQMARDLAPALVSGSLQTVEDLDLTTQLAGSDATAVPNSDNLFWQAPAATNTYGNVCEVGYLLVKTTATGTTPSKYQLQRFFVAPDTSYPTPNPTPAASTRTYQIYDAPFGVLTVPWLANLTATNFQSCLATLSDGVLGLWIRLLDRNGDPVPWMNTATNYSVLTPKPTMKFNSAASFNAAVLGSADSFTYTDPTRTAVANRLPTAAEITIVTLDARSLTRAGLIVPAPPAAASPADVPTEINNYLNTLAAEKLSAAQVFSRTVILKNGTD